MSSDNDQPERDAPQSMVKLAVVIAYALAGAAAVTYGLYLWWEPAAWLFAGAYAIFDAWRLG